MKKNTATCDSRFKNTNIYNLHASYWRLCYLNKRNRTKKKEKTMTNNHCNLDQYHLTILNTTHGTTEHFQIYWQAILTMVVNTVENQSMERLWRTFYPLHCENTSYRSLIQYVTAHQEQCVNSTCKLSQCHWYYRRTFSNYLITQHSVKQYQSSKLPSEYYL